MLTAEVPEEWAATMSLGVVAGRARGALVDACAAYRASDSQVQDSELCRTCHTVSLCFVFEGTQGHIEAYVACRTSTG